MSNLPKQELPNKPIRHELHLVAYEDGQAAFGNTFCKDCLADALETVLSNDPELLKTVEMVCFMLATKKEYTDEDLKTMAKGVVN